MVKSLPIEPSSKELKLGQRLRAIRQERRLTMDQVSEFSGVSKSFLSRIERDITSPSVSTLVSICQVLGVSPGEVLDFPETEYIALKDAPLISLGGDGITEQLLTPPSNRQLQLIRAEIAPGGRGETELYTMDCDVESLHVISGTFNLILERQTLTLHAGDTATFAGLTPHTWENPGDTAAIVLWALSSSRAAGPRFSTLPAT
ncbi:helix-turn-helix domain-containing protein [Corynebacterium lizhenjunii]|uniref:helix-turn-helix domain-containing protein n=1 Tax=Corynebacterium lizhenjunii TaxID=2709394 RepID=UPI001F28747F|nr:helix-turn-helix domain-containing protein [Corynebacterium lizhenjunii]